ncbi:hypothetical protein HQ560_05430 [bacterium]|nr:hypothetical protein [bacterium]
MTTDLWAVTHAIAQAGASYLVQSTLLLGVALVAARLMGGTAATRSAIYRASLAAAAVLPLVAVLALGTGAAFGVVPFPQPSAPMNTEGWHAVESDGPDGSYVPARTTDTDSGGSAGSTDIAAEPHSTGEYVCAIFAGLWFWGSCTLLAHLLVCHCSLAQLRRRARLCVDLDLMGELHNLSERLGVRPPRLLVSDETQSPLLAGFLRPAIILPGADVSDSPARLRGVLLHELAHLVRHDCLANLTARIACVVYFFQPLLWVLARRMEKTDDEIADDTVIGAGVAATDYARDLADWAERYVPTRGRAAAALGVVRFRSALAGRVRRILNGTCALGRTLTWKGVAGIALAMGTACLAAGTLAVRGDVLGPRTLDVTTIEGTTLRLSLDDSRESGRWVPVSSDPEAGWRVWYYRGGTGLTFEERLLPPPLSAESLSAESFVIVRQDGHARVAGVSVTGASDGETIGLVLGGGEDGFTIWFDGDDLDDLPLLPAGRDLALVCDARWIDDLSPLARQRSIHRLVLLGGDELSDLTPLLKIEELEYVALIRCPRVRDLSPLASLQNLAELTVRDCPRVTDLSCLANMPKLKIIEVHASADSQVGAPPSR